MREAEKELKFIEEKPDDLKPVAEQFMLPIDLSADEQTIFNIIPQDKQPLAIDDLRIKNQYAHEPAGYESAQYGMQGYIHSLPGNTYQVS